MKYFLAVMFALTGCGIQASSNTPRLTYHRDVRPIIEARCGECHVTGGTLPRFDEATVPTLIGSMLAAVDSGLMPPWLPGPLGVPLHGVREILPRERAVLESWEIGSRIVGSPEEYTPPMRQVGYVPNRPADAVVIMDKAYTYNRGKQDENRCFLLPPFSGQIEAYQWASDPTVPKHHMAAMTLDAAAYRAAQAMDPEADGWDCQADWKVSPLNLLGAVGMDPTGGQSYPAGTAVVVPYGIVLQVHALPKQAKGAGRDGIKLWLANGSVAPILSTSLSAPAELPCPDSTTGSCSRDVALANPADRAENDRLLKSCGYASPADYIQRATSKTNNPGHFMVHSECAQPSTWTGNLVGLHIHAHTRATAVRLSLRQPDGTWKILLDIPRWRYLWEGSYQPKDPIDVKQGQLLKLECTFDNGPLAQFSAITGEPGHDGPATPPLLPPTYVKTGTERADEMCTFFGDLVP